jgi:hypothetical protein
MGEVATLKVPAEYVETAWLAAIAEVELQTGSITEATKKIREARLVGRPLDYQEVREADLAAQQRCLNEDGALLAQIPPVESKSPAELSGPRAPVTSLAEEGALLSMKAIDAEGGATPIDPDAIRAKIRELDWWLSEYESHEAARAAEAEREKASV